MVSPEPCKLSNPHPSGPSDSPSIYVRADGDGSFMSQSGNQIASSNVVSSSTFHTVSYRNAITVGNTIYSFIIFSHDSSCNFILLRMILISLATTSLISDLHVSASFMNFVVVLVYTAKSLIIILVFVA